VLPEIGRRSPPLRALLDHARPTGVDDGVVTLAFSLSFARESAASSENEALLTEVLGQALGGPVRVRLVEEDAPAGDEPTAPVGDEPIPAVEQAVEPVSEHDLFDQIKEAFDAHEVKESR
jgi:hypothetical protein